MTNSPAPKTAINPGKLAVIGILLVAVGLAGFAWWWNWQRTVKCREFYGGEGAHLIRTAKDVEAMCLTPYLSGTGTRIREGFRIGSNAFQADQRQKISGAAGLIHARTALLDDHSYAWDDLTHQNCVSHPLQSLYAVRFRDGERTRTLVFDFECQTVWVAETQQRVALEPKIATGWQQFLVRQLYPKVPPDRLP